MDKLKVEGICDARCPSHSGILADICKGDKWVFTEDKPTFAVTYSDCVGGCGIFGKISSTKEVKEFLDKVFADMRKDGDDEFEFSCENEELVKQLIALYPEKTVDSEMEYSYRNEKTIAYLTKDILFDNISICQVDNKLLEDFESYEDLNDLQERIEASWKSNDDFLERSLCFVAIKDKKIIGHILGSGKYQNYLAIDIEVDKDFRKKGIAIELTKHFLNACNEKGYIAQWDCVESNIPSRKTAEKVGLKLLKIRPYYWFEI